MLDDAVCEFFEEKSEYTILYGWDNVKMLLMVVAMLVAAASHFYKSPVISERVIVYSSVGGYEKSRESKRASGTATLRASACYRVGGLTDCNGLRVPQFLLYPRAAPRVQYVCGEGHDSATEREGAACSIDWHTSARTVA